MKQWHVLVFIAILSGVCEAIESNEFNHGDIYEDESYLTDETRNLPNKSYTDGKLNHDNSLQVEDLTNPCKNGGIHFHAKDICLCKEPFKGPTCEEEPCNPNPCKNNHTCEVRGGSFRCDCRGVYHGVYCEKVLTECDCGDAECFLDADGIKADCICTGKQQKFKNICLECDCGDADCLLDASGTKFDCRCNKTQKAYNEKCINCDCGDVECQLDGNGSKKECICSDKQKMFQGKCVDCDCGEVPCQLDLNGKKKCVCYKNQTLSNGKCIECDCGENARLCYYDNKGGKQCVCLPGSAQLGGNCTACSCGENARSCLFNKEGGLVCYCKIGYSQKNDMCYESCKTDKDCLNGGICRKEDGGVSSFCKCPSEFIGGWCQNDTVCESMKERCDAMGAVCRRNSSIRLCECRPGKAYSWVSGVCEDICDDSKCNNGACIVTGLKFRCICHQGYTGLLCNEKIIRNSVNVSSSVIVLIALCVAIVAFCSRIPCLVRSNRKLKETYLQQTKTTASIEQKI